MSDMVIKGTGPNQSVSISGRSDDPLYTSINISHLPDLKLAGGTEVRLGGATAINLAGSPVVQLGGTAGVKGEIKAEAKADAHLGGTLGIKLALPDIRLTPDIRIRFRLFGFTVGEIGIAGNARVEA